MITYSKNSHIKNSQVWQVIATPNFRGKNFEKNGHKN